jgi:hypothetical protein
MTTQWRVVVEPHQDTRSGWRRLLTSTERRFRWQRERQLDDGTWTIDDHGYAPTLEAARRRSLHGTLDLHAVRGEITYTIERDHNANA